MDEIGRDEIRLLRELMALRPSGKQLYEATVRCHDLEGRTANGEEPPVVCSSATLSRVEALGLVESAKGQGYEEQRGPTFCMELTTRGRDLLSRKWLVAAASVFPAQVNKWIAFALGVIGVSLAVGDVLYTIGKWAIGA